MGKVLLEAELPESAVPSHSPIPESTPVIQVGKHVFITAWPMKILSSGNSENIEFRGD